MNLELNLEMFEEFYDKLKEYYQMKNEYEQDFKINKNKILKSNGTVLEKQEKIKELKPKCINCKRPVGTIFNSIQMENVLGKTVVASCGDKTKPCPLKIELYLGYIRPLMDLINEETNILNEYKKEIINLKNKLIIGIISEKDVIEFFKILKDKINISSKLLETYNEQYSKITQNKEIIDKIKINSATLSTLLEEMDKLYREFYNTNNNNLIKDAMEIYINDFMPLIKSQLKEKYEECKVSIVKEKYEEFNDSLELTSKTKFTYLLTQNKNKPESLECIITEPKILSFEVGTFIEQDPNKLSINKKKSKKNKENDANKKTLKHRK